MTPSPAEKLNLVAIKARVDAASKGPWWVAPWTNLVGKDDLYSVDFHSGVGTDDGLKQADAKFIAAARDDVPLLVAEIERLQKQLSGTIYDEIRVERERAHAKHGATSMESQPADALLRLLVLVEEVGEVAKEFNDARHRSTDVDFDALRHELIQVASTAAGWADAIDRTDLRTSRPA